MPHLTNCNCARFRPDCDVVCTQNFEREKALTNVFPIKHEKVSVDTMSHFPNQSYYGQYYFNPQWIPAAGGSQPSVVYNNVVNFTVGPDGTHYFHQTYSGQFVAPQGPTVDMKMVRYKIPPQQSTRAMRLYSPFCARTKNPPL